MNMNLFTFMDYNSKAFSEIEFWIELILFVVYYGRKSVLLNLKVCLLLINFLCAEQSNIWDSRISYPNHNKLLDHVFLE